MVSDETVKESAKAVQETAKATGMVADLAGKAGAFVAKVVGGPAQEIGEIFTDRIRLFRYKNLCAVADKVEAIHRKRKIEGKTVEIPPRLAIPLLESAALEDSEIIQDVWAKLIANATDANFKLPLHPGFIEIVKQLSPDEAQILQSFLKLPLYPNIIQCHVDAHNEHAFGTLVDFYSLKENTEVFYNTIYQAYGSHCKTIPLSSSDDSLSYLDNLLRVRVIELAYNFSDHDRKDIFGYPVVEHGKPIRVPAREEYLRMTVFGQNFMAACIADTV